MHMTDRQDVVRGLVFSVRGDPSAGSQPTHEGKNKGGSQKTQPNNFSLNQAGPLMSCFFFKR